MPTARLQDAAQHLGLVAAGCGAELVLIDQPRVVIGTLADGDWEVIAVAVHSVEGADDLRKQAAVCVECGVGCH